MKLCTVNKENSCKLKNSEGKWESELKRNRVERESNQDGTSFIHCLNHSLVSVSIISLPTCRGSVASRERYEGDGPFLFI